MMRPMHSVLGVVLALSFVTIVAGMGCSDDSTVRVIPPGPRVETVVTALYTPWDMGSPAAADDRVLRIRP
jgi:hypothetical protein